MSVYGRILLATMGSAALLLGAFGFQYIGKLDPCPMCLWQRWPHAVAIVLGAAAMMLGWGARKPIAWAGAATMAVSAGLGLFHAGVEQGWWDGPGSCTGVDPSAVTTDDLFKTIMEAPLVRCDEIVWDQFGITMAGWNGIFSAGLCLLWVFAALPKRPTRHVAPG